uniref:Uncharacterized protein n=1 Tax=Eutreptiella gymnastica TaxID=73025 RepID=A0A7S1I0X7_9EUGL
MAHPWSGCGVHSSACTAPPSSWTVMCVKKRAVQGRSSMLGSRGWEGPPAKLVRHVPSHCRLSLARRRWVRKSRGWHAEGGPLPAGALDSILGMPPLRPGLLQLQDGVP